MTELLRIAEDLELPIDSITQTFAILAKRGAGKTYTASVLVEEMLGAGAQVVVIDPLDAWWGLRSSADGESPGLPIVVMGGAHGDVPLDDNAGTAIADLIVEEQLPAVLSLRHLSKSAQRRFVTDFAERLYHRKGEDQYRQPLHVVIDEADAFVPQRVMADTARVMGSIDDLVRRGRSSGIGVTLISQRASVVHKDVLTQIEVLVALRTVSPQDRKAIESWIEAHDPEDQGKTVLASLASLPIGTAWFWSPGWLELLQRVKVRTRTTFDSSSTPSVGEVKLEPATLAPVDLQHINERLAATIEQAAQDDPKLLRRRIAELERQLQERPTTEQQVQVIYQDSHETIMARNEIRQQGAEIEKIRHDLGRDIDAFIPVLETFRDYVTRSEGIVSANLEDTDPAPDMHHDPPFMHELPKSMRPEPETMHRISTRRATPARDLTLRRGERRILEELARLHPSALTRQQVATLSGFAVTGGTFGTYLGVLRRNGLIEDEQGIVAITPEGLEASGFDPADRPRSTADLVEMWKRSLRAGERNMLDVVVDRWPSSVDRQELADACGFTASGGTFGTYLGILRRNGLIVVEGQSITASETLFLGREAGR